MKARLEKFLRYFGALALAASFSASRGAQAQSPDARLYTLAFVRVTDGAETGYTLQKCFADSPYPTSCSYVWRKDPANGFIHPIILKAVPKTPSSAGVCSKIANAVIAGVKTAASVTARVAACGAAMSGLLAVFIGGFTTLSAHPLDGRTTYFGLSLAVGGMLSMAAGAGSGLALEWLAERDVKLFGSRRDGKLAFDEMASLVRTISRTVGINSFHY